MAQWSTTALTDDVSFLTTSAQQQSGDGHNRVRTLPVLLVRPRMYNGSQIPIFDERERQTDRQRDRELGEGKEGYKKAHKQTV